MHSFIYLIVCLLGFGLPAVLPKKYLPFSEFAQQVLTEPSVSKLGYLETFSSFFSSKTFFIFYSKSYLAITPLITVSLLVMYLKYISLSPTPRILSQGFFFKFKRGFSVITLLWLFLAAFYISSFNLTRIVNQQIPDNLTKIDLVITGTVINLPKAGDAYSRFYFLIDSLSRKNNQSKYVVQKWGAGKKVQLSWRSYELAKSGGVQPGEKYRLVVRLKKPRGMVNDKGFDYQAWLLRQGIRATGYVKKEVKPSSKKNIISDNFYYEEEQQDDSSRIHFLSWSDISIFISRLRFGIAQYFDSFSNDYQHLSIFKALIIGDKSDVKNEQWKVFSDTGTIHLMAISGLHIGLVATAAFFISSILCKFTQAIVLRLSYRVLRTIPSLCSIVFSTIYALLAGMSIPTQRAMIVVILLNLAFVFGIKTSFFRILLIAAIIISALDPFSFMQPGFWLSFSAVTVLIYVFSARLKKPSGFSIFLLTQVVVFFGLSIGLVLLNLPLSVSSILANIIAVPLVSFIILPSLFLFLFISLISQSLAEIFLYFADACFSILISFLRYFSGWDLLYRFSSDTFFITLVFGGLGVLLLFSPRGLHFRFVGLMLFISIFFHKNNDVNRLKFSVLDVGQGLSIVASEKNNYSKVIGSKGTSSSTIVYDVGAKFSESFDVGSRVVIPFLYSHGISRIDSLIISHLDNDHAGGFEGVLAGITTSQIITGQKIDLRRRMDKLKELEHLNRGDIDNINIEACHSALAGKSEFSSDFTKHMNIEILWPVLNWSDPQSLSTSERVDYLGNINKKNNYSCVILIRYAGKTILVMGDAESKVEKYLLKHNVLPKNIDILIAGHHGSNTSSTDAFVTHTNARHVVFSAGYENAYRHPSQKVVDRFASRGSEIYITGLDGQIDILIQNDGTMSLTRKREQISRRWY